LTCRTARAGETEALGARLARDLEAGDVVLVRGELGSGKTTFVRGASRALGVTDPVTSPTFTIGHRYRGRVPVSHLDLYRLPRLDVEEPGLVDDYLGPDTVTFIEWPAAAEPELAGLSGEGMAVALTVELRHAGGDRREIEVVTGSGRDS
jgi:tRNA threonylcarbamoyladenosine biosynthesis protein TsaE